MYVKIEEVFGIAGCAKPKCKHPIDEQTDNYVRVYSHLLPCHLFHVIAYFIWNFLLYFSFKSSSSSAPAMPTPDNPQLSPTRSRPTFRYVRPNIRTCLERPGQQFCIGTRARFRTCRHNPKRHRNASRKCSCVGRIH